MPGAGSSPRIRGKFRLQQQQQRRGGIIPANTGKIPAGRSATPPIWDHPREYGENVITHNKSFTREGSSPRIRGKWGQCAPRRLRGGIIPANTGKIHRWCYAELRHADHPREYGENQRLGLGFQLLHGSSPRIRGKSKIVCDTL